MAKKTTNFNKQGIDNLPDSNPVVYKIKTAGGKTNYSGIAKRGRVQDRLREHLPGGKDPIPGQKVEIEQVSSIKDAQKKEQRIISRTKPKYNKRGK